MGETIKIQCNCSVSLVTRALQGKPTLRYRSMCTGMAVIKETSSTEFGEDTEQMKQRDHESTACGVQRAVSALENCSAVS